MSHFSNRVLAWFTSRARQVSVTRLLATLVSIAAGSVIHTQAQAANCTSRTMIVVGHPDDAFAFMHDSTLDILSAGGCIDLVSMTSYYDNNVVFMGRETGARAMYELFTKGMEDKSGTGPAYGNQLSYGNYPVWRYDVFTDNQVRLWFFRQNASTYPGFTAGSLYDKHNEPGLIDALTQLVREVAPTRLLTLNTTGLLYGPETCDVQRNGVLSSQECDHYDHVAAARLALAAVRASGLSIEVREHNTYDVAAGRSGTEPIGPAACQQFCLARDTYVRHDAPAVATPWGSLLNASEIYRITVNGGASTVPIPLRWGRVTSDLATNLASGPTCLGTADGTTTAGVQIASQTCSTAPPVALMSNGELRMGDQCVVLNATAASGVKFRLATCSGASDQRWRFDPAVRALKHQDSGLVMDIYTASSVPGTPITLFEQHAGYLHQLWSWKAPVASTIKSTLASGLCLGGGMTAGAPITLVDCNTAPWFELTSASQLRSGALCLDVGDAAKTKSRLYAANCAAGQSSQRWSYDGKSRVIQHKSTGLVLDVPSAIGSLGQILEIFPLHGGTNQQWIR